MKKIKTRIGILFILLTVFTMFASCLNDDDELKDKQKTVTLYVSATTGECTGMTGTPHECMLIKEKGEKTWDPCEFNGIEGFTYEKGYEYELLATKTIYANPPADGSNYDYTLVFCHASLLLKQNPVGEINIFIVYRRPKYIFFIVYRRQDGNAICPRERFASAKHLQKTANIAIWREKTCIFCGGKTLRGYF